MGNKQRGGYDKISSKFDETKEEGKIETAICC